MVVDYSKGKVYKLVNDKTDDVYIGSTAQTLCVRLAGHKRDCKKFIDSKKNNITSVKLFENDSKVEIVLIESVICNSREELHRRERYYIENTKCVNKCIPTQTKKEHYEKNKDKILEKQKEFYEKNKDEIKLYTKEYRCNNKDKISEYKKEHYEKNKDEILEKQKEFYEKNKDEILERNKEFYEKNKDEINLKKKENYEKNKDEISERNKVKVKCGICGKEINKASLSRHKKTQHL